LTLLPRRCPICGNQSIVGHGRRRKQAHDQQHAWIWVRRGHCRPCHKTFTIVPVWSPPYGQYSFHCRAQAWDAICNRPVGWELSTPLTQDPDRSPDAATLRRWAVRRLVSLCCGIGVLWRLLLALEDFWSAPTILAWDWPAASRILRLEANSP
jgi:hypothetical protein